MIKRSNAAFVLMLFFTVAVMMAALFAINASTPSVANGAELPKAVAVKAHSITGVSETPGEDGVRVTLHGCFDMGPLAITMSHMGSYTLYLNGNEIKSYGPSDPYSQVSCVELDDAYIGENGEIELFFETESWGSRSRELITGILNAPPKLLIGPLESATDGIRTSYGVALFTMGMYAVLFICSAVLFIGRPKAKSFLLLSWVSAAMFVTTAFTSANPVIELSQQTYYLIRPALLLCPVMIYSAVGLHLLIDELPPRMRRISSVKWQAALTVAAVAAQMLSKRSFYHAVFLLSQPLLFYTIHRAVKNRRRGAWLLFGGYAAGVAIVAFVYAINVLQVAPAGIATVYVRITQFGYLAALLCCMVVIELRLGDTTAQAERLVVELEKANAVLDSRVEERTKELISAREQKQTMMLNIFHDLRNPVFVLKGCLERMDLSGEREKGFKRVMEERTEMLERMIEELFLLEKLESGKLLMDSDFVCINDLLKSAASAVNASRSDVKAELALCDERLCVWGDELRLQQVVTNLFENAALHTRGNGPIKASLERAGDTARLCVADNGSGIAQEDMHRVFDRYFSNSGKRGSSGLGLSIAKELVEAHGGSISANNGETGGAVFTVVLPLMQRAEEQKELEE